MKTLINMTAASFLALGALACGSDDDDSSATPELAGDMGGTDRGTGDPADPAVPTQDIVDIAVGAGSFETLVAAVTAADLVDTLKGEGPFTVFAPTDDAFAALPAGTVDDLLLPENKDALTGVLTYHVVPGKVLSSDVVTLTEAETVQGASVSVNVDGDMVMINDAMVTQVDIEATNGVIHVIDAVLLPPAE